MPALVKKNMTEKSHLMTFLSKFCQIRKFDSFYLKYLEMELRSFCKQSLKVFNSILWLCIVICISSKSEVWLNKARKAQQIVGTIVCIYICQYFSKQKNLHVFLNKKTLYKVF